MKNIKKICRISFLALSLYFTQSSSAQVISDHFFGENAWMPDTVGNAKQCQEPPCILYGKLHKQWDNIKNSKTSIVRFGGTSPDKNMPTNYQYIRMIDSIRANGMEPIIQVPFYNYRYTAQQAAGIVNYINVVKGKHIKYWIIGNEPNLGYSYTTAAQIANYFRPFATAMKNADPSILIIGPEIAWFDQGIITGLTTPNGPDDITGKDGSGRYYLDVISFHTYPFNGSQTRSQVVSKLTATGSLQDNLTYLNTRVAACNSAHSRIGAAALKTAITEANISYQNDTGDNLNGVGTNSFIGGQFIAEMLCIGMKNSVDFMNIWSVIEGNTSASSLGFIDPSNYNKKPSYYHFKLLAENFKGTYVNGTTNLSEVKSFGSKNSQQISVLLLNENLTKDYNYTVRLDNSGVAGSDPLKINMNAGINKQFSGTIDNQTSLLLVFDGSGNIVKKIEYKHNGNADVNLPPTITDVVPVITAINTVAAPAPTTALEVKVYPNPSSQLFNIKISTPANEDISVKIYDMTGRLCLDIKEVEADKAVEFGENLKAGYYIAEVTQANKKQTTKFAKIE